MARQNHTKIGSTERAGSELHTPLTKPIDIDADATIDVPADVIEEAKALGVIGAETTVADLECWLVNNTSYSLGVTVDGEPLADVLEELDA